MENTIETQEEREKWEVAVERHKANMKALNEWKESNYEVFNRVFEFRIFIQEDNYSHGGIIINKENGKKYTFKEWGRCLKTASTRALRNFEKSHSYKEFDKPLMSNFMASWVDEQADIQTKIMEEKEKELNLGEVEAEPEKMYKNTIWTSNCCGTPIEKVDGVNKCGYCGKECN